MVVASIVCFALAALGGVLLASLHARDKMPPLGLALAHGGLAAAGLVLLVASALTDATALGATGGVSVGAFLVAALGGFYVFSRRFVRTRPAMGVIVVHALVAVIGFALLLYGVFA